MKTEPRRGFALLPFCGTTLLLFSVDASWSRTAAADSPPAGMVVYNQHCAACHGTTGDGNGPASVWLFPRPRDFSAGQFKIKSTPGLSLPTDEDLLQSITRGLPGSSMPSFSYLDETERREVVRYVKQLTTYQSSSGKRVNWFDEAAANGTLAKPVEVPAEPAAGVQELTLGREVYRRMQCALCHGETGAGDGPQVPTLKDSAGFAIIPRDFNTGLFRGGHTGRDLYLRIHNGLPGTPMIPYGEEILKPEERWALVHYVQSLRRTDVAVNDLLAPADSSIHVVRITRLPTEPLDPLWETMDPVRVPLNPLWPEPNQIYALAVSGATDGRRIAILLQWRDELPRSQAIRVQDFQDAVALQFSLTGKYGFLGMGDRDNPVNLWQWKAGWQAIPLSGDQEMKDAYPSMHADAWAFTNYSTAVSAGNLISQPHRSPVEDANARGFGSFTSQSATQQNVSGKGVWHDGFWSVVLIRDLASPDADDVKFAAGKAIPVALAVWNGEQGDRNGQKMVSNWYQLVLDNVQVEAP